MIGTCPLGSEYYGPLPVLTLTGLRPSELAKGVEVSFTSSGHLSITIQGAKVTEISGQPERQIWLKVDNPIAWRLFDAVEAHGGMGA